MAKITPKQKQIAMIGGAGILLYLLYRWYQSNQANAAASTGTATGATATDPSASDYAAQAGQEQSDVAGLQGQEQSDVGGLQTQEQSDVAGLTSALGAQTAQETSDVSGLTAGLQALATQITGLAPPDLTPLTSAIAALAIGQTKLDRSVAAMDKTTKVKPESAFAKYYKEVTGKKAPASIATNNFVYEAFKNGIKATALKGGSKATTHPASKNTHVAHPNPTHAAKTTKPKAKTNIATQARAAVRATAVKPKPKPAPARRPAPAPKKPVKKSGARR